MGNKPKFKILICDSYLAMIKASRGSGMFRHIYVRENNREKDILKNGELSCAYYVSCILKIFDLISTPHATVDGTIRDMKKNGWREANKLKPGNVLVWEEATAPDKKLHSHIGFYLGKNKAISHLGSEDLVIEQDKKKIVIKGGKRLPMIHHYTYNNKRRINKILTHSIIK